MPVIDSYLLGTANNSFIGAANREDLLDVVTLISPTDSPCFTMFRKTKVSNMEVSWLVDRLDQAGSNAVAEGSSAVFQTGLARVRLNNYLQVSRESYEVSDDQRAANPAGIQDEFLYQMGKGMKQWKRDVEFDIINGQTASAASTRCARGIFFTLSAGAAPTAAVTGSNTAANLQEADLNSRLQAVWTIGGMCDYVIVTPSQKNQISSNFAGSANSRRNIAMTENTVVNVVDFYLSDFGNVKILPHRWLGLTGLTVGNVDIQRTTLMIQSDKWLIGFLRPPKNVPLAKIGSSERAMIEGAWTLICLHPSAGSFVSGHKSAVGDFPSN